MARPADTSTLDLFAGLDTSNEPRVQRFEEVVTRAATLRATIARAVSAALKDCGRSRAEIAAEMAASLGEEVTENMLNAYASEAREGHTIPYVRLLALVLITGDARLLQLGAEQIDHVVADARYLKWIKVGMEADRREQITKAAAEADKDFELSLRAARRGIR